MTFCHFLPKIIFYRHQIDRAWRDWKGSSMNFSGTHIKKLAARDPKNKKKVPRKKKSHKIIFALTSFNVRWWWWSKHAFAFTKNEKFNRKFSFSKNAATNDCHQYINYEKFTQPRLFLMKKKDRTKQLQ